jgi:hypothetical protein
MKSKNININILLKCIVTVAGLTLVYCCGIVDPNDNDDVSNTNHSATQEFSYKLNAEGKNSFELSSVNGNIQISGVSSSSNVVIEGEKKI